MVFLLFRYIIGRGVNELIKMDTIALQLERILCELNKIVLNISITNYFDYFIQFIIVISGVIAGGWVTIKINKKVREEEKYSQELNNANIIMLSIYRFLNKVSQWNEDIVEKYKESPIYYIEIPAYARLDEKIEYIDSKYFSFLMDTNENKQIALDIIIAQDKFHSTIQAYNERNKYYLHVQDILMENGIEDGQECDIRIIDNFDKSARVILQRYTDQMIDLIKSCEAFTNDVKDRLYNCLVKKYGKDYILYYKKTSYRKEII